MTSSCICALQKTFLAVYLGTFQKQKSLSAAVLRTNTKKKRRVEPQQSTLKDIDYKTDHNLTKRNAIHCRCTRGTLQKACKFARHMGWVSPEPSITILQRRLNTRWQRRWGRCVRNNRRSCKDCCGEGWYCTRGWYILVGGKTNSGNGNFLWFIFSPPRLLLICILASLRFSTQPFFRSWADNFRDSVRALFQQVSQVPAIYIFWPIWFDSKYQQDILSKTSIPVITLP